MKNQNPNIVNVKSTFYCLKLYKKINRGKVSVC
ncbi:hypothetical protein BE22_0012 [Staphylococcus phage vB_SepS_BE22]|nr:hypothetical protein BE22_0012 [Staphylococcus phage vB_SepS_BE22]